MISISNNLIPLNDEFAIMDNEAHFDQRFLGFRNIGSWFANFFKNI